MADYLPRPVEQVIEEFERLPGIGPKSAARLVYHFLRSPNSDATRLGKVLTEMDQKIQFCTHCFNVSETEVCPICRDITREQSKLCVVEEPLDLVAFEKSALFRGLYFVLGGAISPAEGISATELRFPQLKKRIGEILANLEQDQKLELIISTNPSLEGEATAGYIRDLIEKSGYGEKVEMSRLAMGLPTGADLEYADRLTLKRALEGRQKLG